MQDPYTQPVVSISSQIFKQYRFANIMGHHNVLITITCNHTYTCISRAYNIKHILHKPSKSTLAKPRPSIVLLIPTCRAIYRLGMSCNITCICIIYKQGVLQQSIGYMMVLCYARESLGQKQRYHPQLLMLSHILDKNKTHAMIECLMFCYQPFVMMKSRYLSLSMSNIVVPHPHQPSLTPAISVASSNQRR